MNEEITEEECMLFATGTDLLITLQHLPFVHCYLQSLLHIRYYLRTISGKLHRYTVQKKKAFFSAK